MWVKPLGVQVPPLPRRPTKAERLAKLVTMWYGNNMRICPRCEKEKSPREFKNQPYCKSCRALYNQERRKEAWKKINRYKQLAKCKDCGNNDPRVLTFDPPNKIVSHAANGASWSKIFEIASTVDVVCANCLCIRQYIRSGAKEVT